MCLSPYRERYIQNLPQGELQTLDAAPLLQSLLQSNCPEIVKEETSQERWS